MPTSLTIALWLITAARAGAGVQLPEGEDPSAWAPAFAFAGLEPSTPGSAPQIRIEDHGDHWTLRALDEQGTFRTADVATPDSDTDRESIALIAGGLIRAMAAASAPPMPASDLPPPPPPPRPATPEPAPAPPPEATPSPTTASAEAPEPATAPEPEPESAPTAQEDPGQSTPEPDPDPTPEDLPPLAIQDLERSPPFRRRAKGDGRRRVAFAPLGFETSVATRRNTAAGVAVGGDLQLHRAGHWGFDLGVSGTPSQWVDLEGAEPTVTTIEIDVTALYRFSKFISAGPMAGASWRSFAQQGNPIGDAWLPGVGARGELTIVGGRWWAVRTVHELRWDIGRIDLVPAGNQDNRFAPFGMQTGLSLVFGDQVDPFRPARTSKGR